MRIHKSLKINNKRITYISENFAKHSESQAIDRFIGIAYNVCAYAIKQINARSPQTQDFFSKIYKEDFEEYASGISNVYSQIIKTIEKNLKFRKENFFVDEDGNKDTKVLASANKDEGVIIIYDAFYKRAEGDEKGLNARSSVIIHEIVHLLGFEKDCETESLESAECFRNFTLLVCEIVKPEDLLSTLSEDEELEGENGELPYRPDQKRHPKGQSNGGQFADEGKGTAKGGNSASDKARSHLGKTDWAFAVKNGKWGKNKWKCNKFVADVLEEAGTPVPTKSTEWGNKYPPLANEWADRTKEIPGFEIVKDPQPGDVVGFQNPKGLGHVGIVSGDNKYISAKEKAIEEHPIDAEKKVKEDGYTDVVYRRAIKKK